MLRRLFTAGAPGLFWALSLSMLAAASGCSASNSTPSKPADGGRYVILINGDSPFWDAVRVGMDQAAQELNIKAVMETNDGTPRGQIDKLRQFGSQSDIVAVAISATDAANLTIADQLRTLAKKGVKVITIDSDVDREKYRDARFAFVGTDNLSGGKVLGQCARALRPDGGAYVQFVGRTGAQNAIERMDGVVIGAGDKLVQRDRMGDDTNRSTAKENVRNAIRNHKDVNVLVGIWSYNAPAIAEVVRELGVRDRMTVVSFDAEPNAIKLMDAKEIDVLVVQNPYQMGYQGLRLLKALVKDDQATIHEMFPQHGQPDGDLYDTGLKVVAPNEGSPLSAEMFDAKTQFLKLSEFRDWLAKYGLKGS